MRFDISDPVPLTADATFLLLRDDMPALVPFLEDAESITVTNRREDGDVVHLVNRWQGSTAKIPGALRTVVKPDLISWDDYASWTASTRSCTWRLQPPRGGGVFQCSGTTRITEDGPHARVSMTIDLEIHPEKVPGVPSFLANRVRGQIEEFIGKQLTANMKNLAGSVRKYADAKGIR
jgi:hypothetical protein